MKRSGKFLRDKLKNKKIVFIEDGFIHSFGIKKKKIPLSICFDKNGIYYDCNSKNDLNNYIKEKLSKKIFLGQKILSNYGKNIQFPNIISHLLLNLLHLLTYF